jgi:hypothetical protein
MANAKASLSVVSEWHIDIGQDDAFNTPDPFSGSRHTTQNMIQSTQNKIAPILRHSHIEQTTPEKYATDLKR